MPRAYVYATLEDELQITRLRDTILKATNAETHYRPVPPHMTVVPPFQISEGSQDEVRQIAKDVGMSGERVSFNGLSVYQNIHNPFVVHLLADVDIARQRKALGHLIETHVARKPGKEFEPHVTLLKSMVHDPEVPREVKKNLQREICNTPPPRNTKIDKIKCEIEE